LVPNVGFIELPSNGTRTVEGVRSGELRLSLANVSGNCSAAQPQPVSVMVQHAAIADVELRIQCVQAGSLVIKTVTTGGHLDPNGYTLTAQAAAGNFSSDVVLPANGTTALSSLRPGDYVLIVSDIMPNCDAVDPATRTIGVGAGAPTDVTIEVVCTAARQLAFVYGTGSRADLYYILTNGNSGGPFIARPGMEADPAWSPDGNVIAFASYSGGDSDIYLLDGEATVTQLTFHSARDYRPAWSPDGKRIAFVSERDGNPEIYMMNADGSNQTRVTSHTGVDSDPDWSPDGTRIAFTRDYDGGRAIFTMNPDGSDIMQITSNNVGDKQPAWSPDGLRIVFARSISQSKADIFDMKADGSDVRRLTQEFEDASDPAWSPDGRQIAFSAVMCIGYSFYYDYCDPHILVLKPGERPFVLTTTQFPAFNPAWRPDGNSFSGR
jgi:Tol biopolymer transport system component